MKKKKIYLKPDIKVHQVWPTAIICTSGEEEIPQVTGEDATINTDPWNI